MVGHLSYVKSYADEEKELGENDHADLVSHSSYPGLGEGLCRSRSLAPWGRQRGEGTYYVDVENREPTLNCPGMILWLLVYHSNRPSKWGCSNNIEV